MTRQRSYFFALAYLLSLTLAVYAAPDETNPSTTFTSTVNATILSTQTPSATVNLPDVQITDTLSSTKTLSAATKTVTKKLLGITKTVTATAAVHTRVKKHCIDFDIEFAGNCCPKRHLKKKKKKPCNKKTKKDQHKGKGKGKGKGKRDEADDDEEEEEEDDEEDTLQERGLSAPIQTTAPCTIGPFTSFTTTMQLQVPIVTAYDFGSSGATLYVQDVIGVNVCGDIYIDGVYSKSTNCPAKDGTATNLGDDQPDPAKAKASGNYAYAYVSIPPGLHSVTFLETYDGGAAGYQIYSREQCPAIEYLDQYTTTEYFTATDTETTTLPATATHTNFVSKVVTSLHAAVTHTLTVTPAAVTKTVTSSATHTTTVHKCHKLKERISCPKHRSRHMLDHWMLGQLKLYKGKTTKKHVGVTCAEYTGEFIY